MSVRVIASDDKGRILAEGRYAGRWDADLDSFVNIEPATLEVRQKGVARWLFAFWPTGALMGVAELAQRLSTEVGGSLTLPVGMWSLTVHPSSPLTPRAWPANGQMAPPANGRV